MYVTARLSYLMAASQLNFLTKEREELKRKLEDFGKCEHETHTHNMIISFSCYQDCTTTYWVQVKMLFMISLLYCLMQNFLFSFQSLLTSLLGFVQFLFFTSVTSVFVLHLSMFPGLPPIFPLCQVHFIFPVLLFLHVVLCLLPHLIISVVSPITSLSGRYIVSVSLCLLWHHPSALISVCTLALYLPPPGIFQCF